ncbi:MAG: hypothetical protein KY452_06495 [Actinobacteria bacterium]|nr:hypothetical protein [Actinomycetota bacterium]
MTALRTWALRHAMGRLRITDDIVRHLSTFQRLGETLEVQLPGELLPVGARTVFRAVRTRAAAQLGVDWVWPHWLERQLDPRSPAFTPRGHLPVLANVTNRNWTMVGNLGSSREAIVDPRGLLTPWFDGWSLDWWVGAADGWHFPSREASVDQRLVAGRPVVETTMPVPGGEAVERLYAIRAEEELVVVEVTNRSPAPLTLALAVRPYNPEGLAVVERIGVAGNTVTVDGRPALLLPGRPAGLAGSTFEQGDVVRTVVAGRAGNEIPESLRCEVGLAQAAFVFPLGQDAVLRAAVPLVPPTRTRRRGLTRRRVKRAVRLSAPLPTSDTVVGGWRNPLERGLRLELPPGSVADAVEANRAFLLLFHDGDEVTPGPYTYHRFWFRDAAYLLAALDRYGFHSEATQVLRSYPRRQHHDGFFFSQRQEWDANGAALWAIAEHWRLTRDADLVRELAPAVARGVQWIERKRHSKRRRKDPALNGLMPASISAEHLGPFDYYYWDNFWSLRGLIDGAALLSVAGDEEAAAQALQWAEAFRTDLDTSVALAVERLGLDAPIIPAGPRRRVDPALIGSLVACSPLGLLPPDDPAIHATAEAVRRRFCFGPAFFQGISHTGYGTYLTLQLAFVELAAGDPRALERLQWMVEAAMPTFTWPEAIHPRLGGGCMGDGHHGWAAADFLSLVRSLLVREVEGGLILCSMLPDEWHGKALGVRDAPTHSGLLSFTVDGQEGRRALSWDLAPHPGTGPVRITAPGLDPTWSSSEPSGRVVLPHEREAGGSPARPVPLES